MFNNRAITIDREGRRRDRHGNHASAFIPGQKPEPDKGQRLGSCNRTACQRPGAVGLHSNGKYYCLACTNKINAVNRRDTAWTPVEIDEEALAELTEKA